MSKCLEQGLASTVISIHYIPAWRNVSVFQGNLEFTLLEKLESTDPGVD